MEVEWMVKKDGAETRKERIREIAKMAHSALHASPNGEISLEKFVASVMYEKRLWNICGFQKKWDNLRLMMLTM
jgi:hypothetical protein